VVGIFVMSALTLVRPHDFWWHVRTGQWILENGQVPTVDHYSFTRLGQPYAHAMWWLMDVLLYLLLRAGDLPLVILVHAITITTAYGLLFGVNREASGGDTRWAALATLAAAAVGLNNWNIRPQSISILFFGLTLYLLARHEQRLAEARFKGARDWALWWLPAIFVVWPNSHGGFVSGLLLVGAYLLGQVLGWLRQRRAFPRQEVLVALGSAAATLLTPQGPDIVYHVLGIAGHPIVQGLTVEWMPPSVRTLAGVLFFGFVALFIVLLMVSGYRPRASEALAILVFGLLALMARRNTIWFGFVAAPTMAAAMHQWAGARGMRQGDRTGRPAMNLALALLIALLALLSLPWLRPYLPLPENRRTFAHLETPVGAVAFLKVLPEPGRVFHSEAYGSYMIWASPEIPVFVDGRIDLYPEAQWQDYIALVLARYDWEAILTRYGVTTLLLDREAFGPLIEAAAAAPGWEPVYQDEQAVVFRRRGGS
jgi:hypothetical protein